jgi:LAGLIDADG-like domain
MNQIFFEPIAHRYFNEKNETYLSATQLIHLFVPEFDKEYWLFYKALQRDLGYPNTEEGKTGYKAYLKSHGWVFSDWGLKNLDKLKKIAYYSGISIEEEGTTEIIAQEWKKKNTDALAKGTKFHNEAEAQQLGSENYRFEGLNKHVKVNKDYSGNLLDIRTNGIIPELVLVNHKYKIAGTTDQPYFELPYVDIDDFKTNGKIVTENKFGKMLHCLSHLDDCVSGKTKLLTKEGIETISEVIGKEIEIWNGKNWSKVTPFQTGENRQLYRVTFSDGSFLDVTEKHKFLIKYRLDKGFKEQTTKDIIETMSKTKWLPRLPNSNININELGLNVNESYDWGFILGDGNVHNNGIRVEIYTPEKNVQFTNCKKKIEYDNHSTLYFDLNCDFGKDLKYSEGLPKILFSWNKTSILKFIAGWLDADGSLQGNSVRLYGKEDKLRDAQLLLTKCNIKSSIKLVGKKGTFTNLGERKNDLWYLHISKTEEIPTQRLKPLKSQESTKMGKWQVIESITPIEGLHNSYCLTEEETHTCVFNNVLTKQCNFNHYNIQLSLYAWMLEQYGYKPRNLGILHIIFSNDNSPAYKVHYPMKYLKKEIEEMLEYYDKNLRK